MFRGRSTLALAELIGKNRWVRHSRGFAKWLKRYTAKVRRRQEKRDPENVPPRATKGWAD
jgi:hypothetical protein